MGCLFSMLHTTLPDTIFKVTGIDEPSSPKTRVQKISCKCPEKVPFDKSSIKPQFLTPIDRFGFPTKCCFCCPPRVAAGFICLLSFLWASLEIHCVDKSMAAIFPERGAAFKYCKMAYMFICLGFLVACACLLLGVCAGKLRPVYCFVWYGLIFSLISLLLSIAGAVCVVINNGKLSNLQTVKIVFAVLWWMLFMYLLTVVNSYKLKICRLAMKENIMRKPICLRTKTEECHPWKELAWTLTTMYLPRELS